MLIAMLRQSQQRTQHVKAGRLILAALAILLLPLASLAETYELTVTRKGKNIYRVDGKPILIHTRYCYNYSYGAEALLRTDRGGGELHFLDDDDACDVKGLYGRSDPKPGKYQVSISHEDDDWYQISPKLYVQTSLCLNLALGEEGILDVRAGGFGRLHFLDSEDSCTVEGVFEKLAL